MKKQYTIKDIAEQLNLHHSTVSRALRNHPDVSEETRKSVLQTARKYNYIPNLFAKSLRSAKSNTIVVMVPLVKNFFFSEVLGVISNLAFQGGYSVMIYQSNEDHRIERQNLTAIMENRVAGVIASVANVEKNRDEYHRLESLGIPVILFDRCYEDDALSRVMINNRTGAYDATSYLIHSGRNHIAFYRGTSGNPVFDNRFQGYVDALKDHGLPYEEHLVHSGELTMEAGTRFIRKLTKQSGEIDAILCTVDLVALGVIAGSRELGLEIPRDLALIGFDNEPAGRIIRPSLTTVAQPVDLVGSSAFEILMNRINGDLQAAGKEIILKMELIKRTSA